MVPSDICNLALGHLGKAGSVMDIFPPDESNEARECAKFYPHARRYTLADHTWTFAIRRWGLNDIGSPPDAWEYRYGWPNGCITPIAVYDPDNDDSYDFEVEATDDDQNNILTNLEGAWLRYIKDIEGLVTWHPHAIQAFSYKLAEMICVPLTGSLELKQNMMALYEVVKGSGAAKNAQAGQALHRVANRHRKYKPRIERVRE